MSCIWLVTSTCSSNMVILGTSFKEHLNIRHSQLIYPLRLGTCSRNGRFNIRASDLFLGFPHRGSSIVFVRCFTLSAGESNVATPFVTSHSGPIAGKGVMGITQSSVLHLADPGRSCQPSFFKLCVYQSQEKICATFGSISGSRWETNGKSVPKDLQITRISVTSW